MKAKMKVPTTLNEITLGQYQRYKKVAEKFEENNDFLRQKMIENFCNVELSHVLLIKRSSVLEISGILQDLFNAKCELVPTFKIKDVEFGFIPNLDKITQGEYADLDSYITDWDKIHKAMAVLYRPIKDKKGTNYSIHNYEGTDEYSELMRFMPLDVAFGAYLFFCRLGNELLNSTLEFLKEEAEEVLSQCSHSFLRDGDGITQFINSLTERYGKLTMLPEDLCTNASHFFPIK